MPRIGYAVRDYFLERGEGYASEFLREWRKQTNRKPSAASISRLFWILRQLDLIEKVRDEPSGRGRPRAIYRIFPGRENDPAWFNPQAALLPETALGRRYGPRTQIVSDDRLD